MKHETQTFEYTYSAQQRDEIQSIRKKYLPKEENKIETLRRLDKSVTKKGSAFSITLGTIGCLIMGTGMSSALVWNNYLIGIPVGILGLLLSACAYPLYKRITSAERARIAPEIIRLTNELMK